MANDEDMKDVPNEEPRLKDEVPEAAHEEPRDDVKEVKEQAMEVDEPKIEYNEAPKAQEEKDAPEDERPKVAAESVFWNIDGATCNAMMSADERLLMSLCDGGFQYLLAGVRCSAGMRSGRYFFETKIVETLNPAEAQRPTARPPMPRQLLRLGVALTATSSILDDSHEKVYFDSEGYFVSGRKRTRAAAHISRDQVVGLLINLDPRSPHVNTLSLFRDGRRISDPQLLPENMLGKTLYPCLTWKNFTLQVNLGPTPRKPLPFVCRMLKDAAAADLEVTQASEEEKHEVIFPVGLPEQGLFDWLDGFLDANPLHIELSDRRIVDWARQSGVHRQEGVRSMCSIDKPGMNFGIPLLDDENVRKTLANVAPALRRNFVHMELRSNLIEKERKAALAKFPSSSFKRIAMVVMGEPPEDFKAKVLNWTLADKERAMLDKLQGNSNQSETEKKDCPKEGSEEKHEQENGEGAGNDALNESKAKDAEHEDEEGPETPTKEHMEVEGEDKPVEPTEDGRHNWYFKRETPDLTPSVLAKSYVTFRMPSQDEGFDEIKYVWQPMEKCAAHMRDWIMELKRTILAEDLQPSSWFQSKFEEWSKALADWKRKHNDAIEKGKSKKEEKKGDGDGADEKGNLEGEDDVEKETKDEKVFDDEPDIDSVDDICDIGNGKPLFDHFEYEDWVLLDLRFELHLLAHAFKKDLDDPDRPGFPEAHLAFYYMKYFKKEFDLKMCNMQKLAELIELMQDALAINVETGFLEALRPADEALEKFVRLTEESRRERQRCIDAGDETATLRFQRPSATASPQKGPDKGISTVTPTRGSVAGQLSGLRGGPVGSSRGLPPRSAPPPRSSYQGSSSKGTSKSSYGSRGSYNPPPPARGSYGTSSASYGGKRPMPPPAPYASKQPRYGSGGGSTPSRSSYPPPSSSYGSRSYR